MNAKQTPTPDTSNRELIIARVLDAPRALVFQAWIEAGHVVHWWGPRGFTTTIHEMDVRPEGVWRFSMHGPDGTEYPNRIAYEEVLRPERIVFSHGSDDPSDPEQFHVAISFEELGNRTRLTMHSVFKTAAQLARVKSSGAVEGGISTLDRLAEYLPTMAGPPNRGGHE